VYDGGSLSFMMQHPYETELHGVDPLVLQGQVDHTFANVKTFNTHRRRVTVHQKYSCDPEFWLDLDGLVIDLLFIDGDHQLSSVIKDFRAGLSASRAGRLHCVRRLHRPSVLARRASRGRPNHERIQRHGLQSAWILT
jgi:hypothetical protein